MSSPVLLTGSKSVWTEPGVGQGAAVEECPCCKGRDFKHEQKLRFNRTCLRCLRNTWDNPAWRPPTIDAPNAAYADVAELERQLTRRERRAKQYGKAA